MSGEKSTITDCFLSWTSWGICQVFTPTEAEQNIEARKRTILDRTGSGLGLFLPGDTEIRISVLKLFNVNYYISYQNISGSVIWEGTADRRPRPAFNISENIKY